jgi:hypothetical protein
VSLAASVCATAVLITFGSDVDGIGGAQAWMTINNKSPRKLFRIVFSILSPSDSYLRCRAKGSDQSFKSAVQRRETSYKAVRRLRNNRAGI